QAKPARARKRAAVMLPIDNQVPTDGCPALSARLTGFGFIGRTSVLVLLPSPPKRGRGEKEGADTRTYFFSSFFVGSIDFASRRTTPSLSRNSLPTAEIALTSSEQDLASLPSSTTALSPLRIATVHSLARFRSQWAQAVAPLTRARPASGTLPLSFSSSKKCALSMVSTIRLSLLTDSVPSATSTFLPKRSFSRSAAPLPASTSGVLSSSFMQAAQPSPS